MATKTIVNGIDTDRLSETMDDIRAEPSLAHFKLRAHQEWLGGAHARTTIRDFYGAGQEDTSRHEAFHIDADEPDVLLGTDHGPNATEALLHALASCVGTTFVYYAAAKGVALRELELDLEGDLDVRGFLGLSKESGPGFQEIRVTIRPKCDAPRETLEELTRLAQLRSPVFNTVTSPTTVHVHLDA